VAAGRSQAGLFLPSVEHIDQGLGPNCHAVFC